MREIRREVTRKNAKADKKLRAFVELELAIQD
jgi:hypothetical protein